MEDSGQIPDEKLERDLGNIIMTFINWHHIGNELQNELDAMQGLNRKVGEGVSSMQAIPLDGVIIDDLAAIERFALAPLEDLLELQRPQLQHSRMNDVAVVKAQLQQRFNRAKDVVAQRQRTLQDRLVAAAEGEQTGSIFFQALQNKALGNSTKLIVGRSLIEVAGQLDPDTTKAAIALGVLYHRARSKLPVDDHSAWRNLEAWSEDFPYPGYVKKLIAGGAQSMVNVDSLARSSLQAGHESVEALDKLRGLLSKPDMVPRSLFNHTKRALARALDTVEETFREDLSASRINVNLAIVNPPSVVLFLHTIYQACSVIHKLSKQVAGSSDAVVRSNCVYELGKLMKCGSLQASQALGNLIEHPDPFVCRSAVSRLCEAIPDFPVRCLTEIFCRIHIIEKNPIVWEMSVAMVSEGLIAFPPDEQTSTKQQVEHRVMDVVGRGAAAITGRFWQHMEEHRRPRPSTTLPARNLRRNLASRRLGSLRRAGP